VSARLEEAIADAIRGGRQLAPARLPMPPRASRRGAATSTHARKGAWFSFGNRPSASLTPYRALPDVATIPANPEYASLNLAAAVQPPATVAVAAALHAPAQGVAHESATGARSRRLFAH
jgi:hypothetical protein